MIRPDHGAPYIIDYKTNLVHFRLSLVSECREQLIKNNNYEILTQEKLDILSNYNWCSLCQL